MIIQYFRRTRFGGEKRGVGCEGGVVVVKKGVGGGGG